MKLTKIRESDTPKATPEIAMKSIRLAVAILDRLEGARYAIYLPDGVEFVRGVKVEQEYERLPKGALRSIYEERIRGMEVGEVIEIEPPEGITPRRLRGSIAGCANSLWGPDAHHTRVTEKYVELLRTA